MILNNKELNTNVLRNVKHALRAQYVAQLFTVNNIRNINTYDGPFL